MGTGPSRSQAREVIQVTPPPPPPEETVPVAEASIQHEVPKLERSDSRGVNQINDVPQQKLTETVDQVVSFDHNSQSVPNDDIISDLDSLLEEDEPRPQTQPHPHMYERPNSAFRHSNNKTAESQRLVLQPPLEISRLTLRTKFNQNTKANHDLQAETENEWNFKKESLDGFDPSKFKIVNSQRKGNAKKLSGDYNSEEEPSLLWRLGLASPADAFSTQTTYVETRSSLPKPPSYDPTEEQLMAMIEKEYA